MDCKNGTMQPVGVWVVFSFQANFVARLEAHCRIAGKRKTYTGTTPPPPFLKRPMPWGKKMAGTNEFAFFRCKRHMYQGGVQNQAEENSKKCLPAGTGTKIYFSRIGVLSGRGWEVGWQVGQCWVGGGSLGMGAWGWGIGKLGWVGWALWPGSSPTDPQTLKKFKVTQKWLKSDFRGVPVKVTQKLVKKWLKKLLSSTVFCHFWVAFE